MLTPHPSRRVDFFSFYLPPGQPIQPADLQDVGIKSPTDVGEWIVETLRNKLDQKALAQKLIQFIHKKEPST